MSNVAVLAEGDPVILVDRKRREHYDVLRCGGTTNIKGSLIDHDAILGRPDGAVVRSSLGRYYHIFAPTLRQHVLHMPRHAQIIYPKDLAMLMVWADIYPGATVVEGGFGSGALTLTLLRALGAEGQLTTYELNPEPSHRARKNVDALRLGRGRCPHTLKIADIYDGIDEREVDRVLLDVPEPWLVVPHASEALRQGGILGCYVPSALQLQRIVATLEGARVYPLIESLETILRPWRIVERSVRPESRMIGHTGFLVFARKGAPRT